MTAPLQVVTSTDRRGAELFALDLHTALADRGWRPRTVALAPGSTEGLDLPTLGERRLTPRGLRALAREARTATAVIAHGSTTLPACTIALLASSVPLVYRSIGDPRYWTPSPLRRLQSSVLLRRAQKVVVLWSGAADALRRNGIPSRDIQVIPNGVPADRFPAVDELARKEARRQLQLEADARIVLYLGALSPEKDVGLAIEALAALPEVQLVIAGDGPERQRLEQLAAAVVPGRVRFLRSIDDPASALAATDVLALPSRTEGIPAVLIEAGLSQVPVVATDVGGVREVVVSGETGLLVPSGDVRAFGAAIGEVLAAPSSLGEAARRRCLERFEIGGIADAWSELLGEVGA